MNIIPHNDDLVGLEEYVKSLVDIGVDALIVADAGIYTAVRSVSKDIEVHMSTQASVTNYRTVKFWHDLGIKRIVMARELSLEEINLFIKKCLKLISKHLFTELCVFHILEDAY